MPGLAYLPWFQRILIEFQMGKFHEQNQPEKQQSIRSRSSIVPINWLNEDKSIFFSLADLFVRLRIIIGICYVTAPTQNSADYGKCRTNWDLCKTRVTMVDHKECKKLSFTMARTTTGAWHDYYAGNAHIEQPHCIYQVQNNNSNNNENANNDNTEMPFRNHILFIRLSQVRQTAKWRTAYISRFYSS